MIQFSRSLARQLRAVFRRVARKSSNTGRPMVSIQADRSGLRARLHYAEVSTEYHEAGNYSPETLAIPLDAFADFEARSSELVTLEALGPGTVQARWNAGVVPQVKDYDAPELDKLPKFPEAPTKLSAADPGLLKALVDARPSTSQDAIRYALNKVQLRGRAGEVVATNGRQALVQSGLYFPFTQDLLVPIPDVFGCKELPLVSEASIGSSDEHVTVRVGSWTFHLPIDKESRYPKVADVIPSLTKAVTRCQLAPEDAAFLSQTLPGLPGAEDDDAPITIDLNGQPAVRARAEGQTQITEVVLARSEVSGTPVRFRTNRNLLARALELGLTDMIVIDPDKPVLCQDDSRKFVFMPLGKVGAIQPGDDCQRIIATDDGKVVKPRPSAPRKSVVKAEEIQPLPMIEDEKPITPPVPSGRNGSGNGHSQHKVVHTGNGKGSSNGSPSLTEEALAVKNLLRDAYLRTNRLIAAIQRQRKESQIVRATLASLRQLQQVTD